MVTLFFYFIHTDVEKDTAFSLQWCYCLLEIFIFIKENGWTWNLMLNYLQWSWLNMGLQLNSKEEKSSKDMSYLLWNSIFVDCLFSLVVLLSVIRPPSSLLCLFWSCTDLLFWHWIQQLLYVMRLFLLEFYWRKLHKSRIEL